MYVSGYADAYNLAVCVDALQDSTERACTVAVSNRLGFNGSVPNAWPGRTSAFAP